MRVSYAIVFVSDMTRSVAFYRDAIGLPLRFASPEWTEFDTGGATLALHASAGRRESDEGQNHAPGTCRPGLSVPDLDVFHARMLAEGVPCLREPARIFGARLAQYSDPDGLAISVGEESSSG